MKKLTQLVLKSYLGPFILTFFISLFILVMQFLWKYIDDLVGKGLEWYIILELLTYAAATFVPLALPLAVLLSSIMTFGNLGEQYELVASKSAGVSLLKLMRPLIFTAFIISISAFYFSNNILPITNLKMGSLLYDVRQQKPALYIKEGVFYSGIEGYVLKVGSKDKDGQNLKNIMIYDHTDGVGNRRLLIAESGKMEMTADERYLQLTLRNGKNYEEKDSNGPINSHPMLRREFKEDIIHFDLSTFQMSRTNEDLFKDHHQMLNIKQLVEAEDTIRTKMNQRTEEYRSNVVSYLIFGRDSTLFEKTKLISGSDHHLLKGIAAQESNNILESALNSARSIKSYVESSLDDVKYRERTIVKHQIEFHRKFTLSFACFVLFFIGAPLGAIIRKGGLGMPVVVSIFFFLSFHIMSITGEKFAKEMVISPFWGMWYPTLVLLPIGAFLTFMANRDSALFDMNSYVTAFKKIFKK